MTFMVVAHSYFALDILIQWHKHDCIHCKKPFEGMLNYLLFEAAKWLVKTDFIS